MDKPCMECIHSNIKASLEPCKSCTDKTHWEKEQDWHKEHKEIVENYWKNK